MASARKSTKNATCDSAVDEAITGPDFPTGCTLIGMEGIKNYFTTGRGSLKVRANLTWETHKGAAKENMLVTEMRLALIGRNWSSGS